jgi:hypothetical protein
LHGCGEIVPLGQKYPESEQFIGTTVTPGQNDPFSQGSDEFGIEQ